MSTGTSPKYLDIKNSRHQKNISTITKYLDIKSSSDRSLTALMHDCV